MIKKKKIFHSRLQHCVNQKLQDVPAVFRQGRRTRDQIDNICWITEKVTKDQTDNIHWIMEKVREFQKKKYVYLCFINYTKTFDCVDHGKQWQVLREWQVLAAAAKSLQSCPTLRCHRQRPTRLPHPWDSPGKNTGVGCHFLLQASSERDGNIIPSYLSPEKSVCMSRSKSYNPVWNNCWFKIEKRARQGFLLSCCLFNLYAEHIMRNATLDELQAGIKVGRRNINREVDDTTLMPESEEELKSLLMRVKEESERKTGLRLNGKET